MGVPAFSLVSAGINLKTSRPTERQIRSAVLEALSNPSYQRTAGVLGQRIARYDAGEAVTEAVNSLSRTSNERASRCPAETR